MTTATTINPIPPGFKLAHTWRAAKAPFVRLAWSPDGNSLAAISNDGGITFWSLDRGLVKGGNQSPSQATSLAWAPNSDLIAVGYANGIIRVWDRHCKKRVHTLDSRHGGISTLAWSPNGRLLASGDGQGVVRLWNTRVGEIERSLAVEDPVGIWSIAWSKEGSQLAAVFADASIRVWNTANWDLRWQRLLAMSAESDVFSLGARLYQTIFEVNRLTSEQIVHRDVKPGNVVLEKSGRVKLVDFGLTGSPGKTTTTAGSLFLHDEMAQLMSDRRLLVGQVSEEELVLNWSPEEHSIAIAGLGARICLIDGLTSDISQILEGHTDRVGCTAFSRDGRLLISGSEDGTARLWRCDSWETVAVLPTVRDEHSAGPCALAFHPSRCVLGLLYNGGREIQILEYDLSYLLSTPPAVVSVNYVSAKVVLVGDSGVGKSALGIRLAEKEFRPTESTHAARFWPIKVGRRPDLPGGVQAEITLWDLAGQPEYRIVHQLFLNDVNLALLLFDCSDPADPFGSVPYWAKVLRKQAPPQSLKFLVSARCDVSPVTVDDHQINLVLAEHSLNRYLRTSAMTGEGIDQLYQQICESIPWHELPRTSTPRLFQVIRDYLLERKGVGDTFVAMEEVRNAIRRRSHSYEPSDAELDMVVRQHQARGLIYLLHPKPDTWWVLLQPELLNQYAASIIRAARNHPSGIGAIRETDVLTASFEMSGFGRLQPAEERLLLEATIELFISHELCIREMGLLVFPSQINLSPPQAAAGHPQAEAIYQFSGSIEAIYASLVVRLTHTSYFQRIDQWKYAAEFSRGGQRLGFSMRQISEATAELEVYFHKDVNDSDRVTFVAFITDHLLMKGIDVREYIRLYCPKCGHEIENHAAIEARIAAGKLDIPCQYCDTSVIIPRGIDERYKSDPAYAIKQRDLSQTAHARTRQELQDFHSDREQFFEETPSPRLRILHLSDIHANVPGEGRLRRTQLEADLMKELGIRRLAYVGVSGDIAMRASAEEYDTGYEVIDGITKRFGLDPSRVVIVPGNHDVNWERSRRSYTFVFRAELAETPDPGHSIDAGPEGILVRCSESYPQRFANFDEHLYRRAFIGAQYPLKYARQAVIHLHPEDRILFLALNSAWEIDHHFRDRASINMEALTHALDQLQDGQYEGWLKIAIFHHPVTGREAMNDDFMQLLAVHGFQIVLHGHVHEAKEGFYKYDDKRGIHIIGAGTFGAPTREQVPGIPLQYNLLSFDPTTRRLTVETRKKEKPDGAWMADARWGDKNNPSPRYTIQLK